MGKRSAVVELFLGDMGSMQRELRPSTQREDQLTMETKLEQIAVKAVNQLPKSVVREIRTPRSVGAGGGRPPPATRWWSEMVISTAIKTYHPGCRHSSECGRGIGEGRSTQRISRRDVAMPNAKNQAILEVSTRHGITALRRGGSETSAF
jgi:hypothetical protein